MTTSNSFIDNGVAFQDVISLNGKYFIGDNAGPLFGHGGHVFRLYMKSGIIHSNDLWNTGKKVEASEKVNCLKVESAYNPHELLYNLVINQLDEVLYFVPYDILNTYLKGSSKMNIRQICTTLEGIIDVLGERNSNKYDIMILESILEDQRNSKKVFRFCHHSIYDRDMEILRALSNEEEPADEQLYKSTWGSSLSVCSSLLTELKENYISNLRKEIWGL